MTPPAVRKGKFEHFMKTLIVGHRGDPTHYPDNSLAGILAAREIADMVEIDVRRTGDGVPVLSHDPHVAGTTLVDHDYADLADLDIGDGHRLATLDQILEELGEFPLNIELKNSIDDPDFDPTHAFAVEVAGRARDIDLITSFDWDAVEAVKAAHPHLTTGLLLDADQTLDAGARAAGEGGHRAVSVHWSTLAGEPAARVASLGELQVYVWTVNDRSVAAILAEAGVTGLITDDPSGIRTALEETT